MSKIVQALFTGIIVTFILDFFLFLGIFLNYIQSYHIDLYYNILFADNQNIFIFTFFSILLGYLILYVNHKVSLTVVGALFVLSFSTLISPIGHFVGTTILATENVKIQTQRFSYNGDIYYNGRKTVILYDYKLDKIITLNKKNIKGSY